MAVLEQRVLPVEIVRPVADLMGSFDLTVWIYRGADWFVPDPKGPHVDREAWTVKFQPKVMTSLDGLTDDVAKIVGVSDDHEAVTKASAATQTSSATGSRQLPPSPTTSTSPTLEPTKAWSSST